MVRFIPLMAGVLVAGLLCADVAFAQGPRGGGLFGRGGRVGGPGGGQGLALSELDLSDAQQAQVREIRARYRDDSREATTQLAAAREKLREAVETVPANEGLIIALTQDLVQAEVDVAIQQARLNTEVWSVLTPEQQVQAEKTKAERQERTAQRRQRVAERRGR